MPKLNWDGNDFRNSQDSSGTVANNISGSGNLQQGYEHGSLTKGLVAYYPMEKGGGEVLHDGALDNIGQIKPGSSGGNTSANDMWTISSKVGNNALNFDGTDDHVNLTNYIIDDQDSYTVSFWARVSSGKNQNQTIAFSNNGSNPYSLMFYGDTAYSSTPTARWGVNDGTASNDGIEGGTAVDDGNWHHVTFVQHGPSNRTIYLDGNVETSDTTSLSTSSYSHNKIGEETGYGHQYNGDVNDVRVYSRALSEPEIEALANVSQPSGVLKLEKNVPSQSEGGISRYKLNGNADDSWGDNNGTNNGADLTATGVYGQAAAFDGSNEFTFRDPLDQIASSNRFSISLWIKPNDIFDGHSRVLSAVDKSNTGILLKDHRNSSGKGYDVTFFDSTGDNHTLNPTVPFKANKWHHWVVCYDGTRLYSYINGSVDKEKSISASISNEKDHTIGGSSTGEGYSGKIDDVRIYDKALTPLQVEKLYHKGAYRIPRESTLQ